MNKKYKWGNAADDVNWTVHGRAMRLLHGKDKKIIKKFMHEWLPVNGHKGVQSNTNAKSQTSTERSNQE